MGYIIKIVSKVVSIFNWEILFNSEYDESSVNSDLGWYIPSVALIEPGLGN